MQRTVLKSKIHNATVTQSNLFYDGSITIDGNLIDKADIIENERVQVVNLNNGSRFETYVIRGESGSKIICLNGPAARMCAEGDTVHVLSYVTAEDKELKDYKPTIVFINGKNEIVDKKQRE
ncbi:MAG: aspartate 1-decarboxylase [Candidatus Latescibacteria bacterium]|jgi:aspartate 1-decarboxylase|nr:aspartate 1-decarboxylase [Candidatus Latescibacterota bacterium]